jgi:DNA-binding transcriptional ArsR family regulator
MEKKEAIEALAALAQEHRLAVFRLLVPRGANGLAAGEIAERVGVPPSTLSHHLAQLERAGLLRSWRVRRHVFYALDVDGTRRLIAFLSEDCCQGHPEICGYRKGGTCGDDHDLPQPEVRNVAQRAGDDPQFGRGTEDHRIPEDAAKPGGTGPADRPHGDCRPRSVAPQGQPL